MDIVFITDTHFKTSSSCRTGSLLEDLILKLRTVVQYCNDNSAILVHGGDFFDSPSVPDMVKNAVVHELNSLKTKCYVIFGNHCTLYRNHEYNYKTSLNLLISCGVVESFDGKTLDFGEFYLTNEKPVVIKDKPQIVVYHGLLNQDDGYYSFYFQDLQTTSQTYVLLGHDHLEYEPIQFGSTKIFRIGSFARLSREEGQYREPKMLHIKVVDGKLKNKLVPIKCRPYDEIFKQKLLNISKAQQKETYEDIIKQIREATNTEMTLKEALLQVTTENVSDYVEKLLTEHKLVSQTINKNL